MATSDPAATAALAAPVVTRAERLRSWAVVVAVPLALVPIAANDPARGGFFPPCPLHALFGLHCPGCGTLRAVHQLLHAHPAAAFGLNPLAMVALPALAYVYASVVSTALVGRSLPRIAVPGGAIRALFAAVVAFGILRNLPWAPFCWLAP